MSVHHYDAQGEPVDSAGKRVSEQPHRWTAADHARRAGELAAAIQPAEERFAAALEDPMERTRAIATGAIKAHKQAIDHTLRVAELHARVADVLLRTDRQMTPLGKATVCGACGQAATWAASERDERNEPVRCCGFCGERLP